MNQARNQSRITRVVSLGRAVAEPIPIGPTNKWVGALRDPNRRLGGLNGSAVFSELGWTEIARSLGLSGRELEIVRGVFDDRTEAAIATGLGISPHTVHTHFDRLHRKLGVVSRVGLVLRITDQFLALALAQPAQQQPAGVGAPQSRVAQSALGPT